MSFFIVDWIVIGIAYILNGIVFATLCRSLASKKGYEKYGSLGFFFGLLAFLYVVGLPLAKDVYSDVSSSAPISSPSSTVQTISTTPPAQPKSSTDPITCPHCGHVQSMRNMYCEKCEQQTF